MGDTGTKTIEIPDPTDLIESEEAIAVAYIGDSGEWLGYSDTNSEEPDKNSASSIEKDFADIQKHLTSKSHDMSRQTHDEVGGTQLSVGLETKEVINPPYPPKCLANFLEVDPVFFRAVKAKVLDSVGRDFRLNPVSPIATPDRDPEPGEITAESFREDAAKINKFIATCNDIIGFQGVLERAAMDFESIGWAGLEVIRNSNGRVVGLDHVPAQRLRVLKGWKGFVELRSGTDGSSPGHAGSQAYFQRFGEKFKVRDPILKKLVRYSPILHGPLDSVKLQPNFVDYRTGEITSDFDKSANEILYVPKHHSNTIYYGFSDIVPALGAIVGNVHIRDYMLQFFEHNTIPRYAVIIKGAKIDDAFREMVTEYFNSHIKGAAHKTLILTLQGQSAQNITIEFKQLDSANKEADFLQTRSANSAQIMTAMGTSPAILGIAEQTELGSGKGLSQAELYKDRIVGPCQKYWATACNLLFTTGLGVEFAELQFNPLDIRDRFAEMQVLTGYQQNGNLSNNEVRKAADLGEAIPGGDTAFVRIREGSAFKIEDLPDLLPPQGLTSQTAPAPTDEDPEDTQDNKDQEDKESSE